MATTNPHDMSDRRALLTERERAIVSGEADDVTNDYRYQTISRVRKRFDRLKADIEAMEKHGELAKELRDVVCNTSEYVPEGVDEPPKRDPEEVGAGYDPNAEGMGAPPEVIYTQEDGKPVRWERVEGEYVRQDQEGSDE